MGIWLARSVCPSVMEEFGICRINMSKRVEYFMPEIKDYGDMEQVGLRYGNCAANTNYTIYKNFK
jgi:hypothetical protein